MIILISLLRLIVGSRHTQPYQVSRVLPSQASLNRLKSRDTSKSIHFCLWRWLLVGNWVGVGSVSIIEQRQLYLDYSWLAARYGAVWLAWRGFICTEFCGIAKKGHGNQGQVVWERRSLRITYCVCAMVYGLFGNWLGNLLTLVSF